MKQKYEAKVVKKDQSGTKRKRKRCEQQPYFFPEFSRRVLSARKFSFDDLKLHSLKYFIYQNV